jgi:hypothetical protein
MNARQVFLGLGLVVLGSALADAAVDCTVREPRLPHVCAGGANDGNACTPDLANIEDPLDCRVARDAEADGCAGAKCTIAFLGGRGTTFRAVLTILVDENVSRSDDDPETDDDDPVVPNVVAVTVILDLGKLGTLAQTYQNLPRTGDAVQDVTALTTAPPDNFGVLATEQLLRIQGEEVDGKARLVNDLVFRDVDEQMSEALRNVFDLPGGKPVVTKVASVELTDQPGGLGTVLRAKIRGQFVDVP